MYGFEPDGSLPAGYVRAVKLHKVLPLVQSCSLKDGELTVVSLDVYEDGSVLNSFFVGNDEIVRRQAEHLAEMHRLLQLNDDEALSRLTELDPMTGLGRTVHMRLEDDVGTTYYGLPRGGGSSDNRMEQSYGFTPAIPGDAARLRILVFEGEYRQETVEAEKGGPARLLHTFEVSL